MKKITIGLFCDSFFPMVDGVVNVVDNYAKNLLKYANVIVFVPGYSDKYDDTVFSYEVVRCNSIKVPTVDYSLPLPDIDHKFKEKLDSYKLDIVHIHSPFTIGRAGIKYAKEHNIPCIGTMHSQFKKDFLRSFKSEKVAKRLTDRLVIRIFNKCDECWAVNSEVAKIFYEDYGYKCLPKVMNNATDMLPVSKEEANQYFEKQWKISQDTLVFLFVGRLNKLKNILFIVDSLKMLNGKINFKMFFVGEGQDEEDLKAYIKENKLEDKIILPGRITNRLTLSYYYSRAKLFLFPSLYDASSLVQVEAASQNTPTMFIEGSATSATVTDRINGFISNNDPNDYANYILEVINNSELYALVSNNAYKDLYITWQEKAKEAYDEYINIINKFNS